MIIVNIVLLIGSRVLMGIGITVYNKSADYKRQTANKGSQTVANQGILFGLGFLFLGITLFVLGAAINFG